MVCFDDLTSLVKRRCLTMFIFCTVITFYVGAVFGTAGRLEFIFPFPPLFSLGFVVGIHPRAAGRLTVVWVGGLRDLDSVC